MRTFNSSELLASAELLLKLVSLCNKLKLRGNAAPFHLVYTIILNSIESCVLKVIMLFYVLVCWLHETAKLN